MVCAAAVIYRQKDASTNPATWPGSPGWIFRHSPLHLTDVRPRRNLFWLPCRSLIPVMVLYNMCCTCTAEVVPVVTAGTYCCVLMPVFQTILPVRSTIYSSWWTATRGQVRIGVCARERASILRRDSSGVVRRVVVVPDLFNCCKSLLLWNANSAAVDFFYFAERLDLVAKNRLFEIIRQ